MSSMYVLLCACWLGLAAALSVLPYNPEDAEIHFERFIKEHDKWYVDENEKQARLEIFKKNLEKINRMNQIGSSVFGVTRFADLTIEEFLERHTGLRKPDGFEASCTILTDADIKHNDAPESFDWRDHNAVTRVKDQGSCGSCYAFSTTGNIESQYAIKNAQLIELSEQQIVDCDKRNFGCGGGVMADALRSIIEQGGIDGEADYPYTGEGQNCQFDGSKVKIKVKDCYTYNLKSQEKLKNLLFHNGPIAIAIQSTGLPFHIDGIVTDEVCNVGGLTHAVLLVGYGADEKGRQYWIIKNSWNESWGEKGYFRVQRGENALSCGLMNDLMSSAVLE